MLQGYTMAIVPCGNPTPKKLHTRGGEWPIRTARAQRTVRPQRRSVLGRQMKDSGLAELVMVHRATKWCGEKGRCWQRRRWDRAFGAKRSRMQER